MDWLSLQKRMPRDGQIPARANRLQALTSVLDGSLYNGIPHAFGEEMSPNGEYVPLSNRRPSVRNGLCRTVVDDSVSLLFSEGHFPEFRGDKVTIAALQALSKERHLNDLFIDAATRGSVGSVALLLKILKSRPFVSVMATANLTPSWDPEDPDSLLLVTERYKVLGKDLRAQGYLIPSDADTAKFWFQRSWDAEFETWFLPVACTAEAVQPVVDEARTIEHGLGFLPVIWIRNLPGGDDVDGACTFEAAIDTAIEIDYQLSQAGRALKYAGDPKLVIRDAAGLDKPVSGGAANAIILSDPTADAKLLEINGSAASAVVEYVKHLRSTALESIHGNRADADKMSAAQSGRALELLNQGLIWLADRLRISYGEGALLQLAHMICAASSKVRGGLIIGGKPYRDLDSDGLSLAWPRWYAPTAEDRQSEAITLAALRNGGLLSRQTAVAVLAATYDVEDQAAELLLIAADESAADARATAMGALTQAKEVLPA